MDDELELELELEVLVDEVTANLIWVNTLNTMILAIETISVHTNVFI